MGSSPHVRGACSNATPCASIHGIIPACAGSIASVPTSAAAIRDHPRMCGEHMYECDRCGKKEGSSPHVRGASLEALGAFPQPRIIPACAGSIRPRSGPRFLRRDHPRMCGEHDWSAANVLAVPGSSPHVRGASVCVHGHGADAGIIPACAGSMGTSPCPPPHPEDHPRMCGEHIGSLNVKQAMKGSSPHVRGA